MTSFPSREPNRNKYFQVNPIRKETFTSGLFYSRDKFVVRHICWSQDRCGISVMGWNNIPMGKNQLYLDCFVISLPDWRINMAESFYIL